MYRRAALVLGLVLLACGLFLGLRSRQARKVSAGRLHPAAVSPTAPKLDLSYGKLPLAFEENRGQVDSRALFVARSRGATVFVTSTGATFSLPGDRPEKPLLLSHGFSSTKPKLRREPAAFTMRVVGADPVARATGLEKLSGIANYFIGNDPTNWRTDIPTFRKVKVAEVYPGIDLVHYGNGGHLEYDFTVAPGADPSVIRVAFEGVDRLRVNGDGDLALTVSGREVIQRRPRVYQQDGSLRRELGSAYVLLGRDEVAFRVDGWDRSRALVIDPVLVYSTYLGGSSEDDGLGIAVDSSGNAYVTGAVTSNDLPRALPRESTRADADAFVAKVNAAGDALVYTTYLGGTAFDGGVGIGVDNSGNSYVTGLTRSNDFPGTSSRASSGRTDDDAFVAKLNASGNVLLYSTYLGGSATEVAGAITVDNSGNAYVVGLTNSNDFPGTNARISSGRTDPDAFVAKLNATGSGLVYSLYLGGSASDSGGAGGFYADSHSNVLRGGVAIDSLGNAYVTGQTNSNDFPGTSSRASSGRVDFDAFVAKVNATGDGLVYSTLIGGTGDDLGHGIVVYGGGDAYVVGSTNSNDFPGATPRETSRTDDDAFVAKLDPIGGTIAFSTLLGGAAYDDAIGVAVSGSGNAYITGVTNSSDFPGATPRPTTRTDRDAFVAKLDPTGSTLVYSIYLGGSADDEGIGIASNGSGDVYVTGDTMSADFPITTTPFQPTRRGNDDAFVAKISVIPTPSAVTPHSGSSIGGTQVTITGTEFETGATVTFGGVSAEETTVSSATTITVTTPSHPAGVVEVAVTNPGGHTGTLADGFTYWEQPREGCGCSSTGSWPMALIGLAALALRRRRRAN